MIAEVVIESARGTQDSFYVTVEVSLLNLRGGTQDSIHVIAGVVIERAAFQSFNAASPQSALYSGCLLFSEATALAASNLCHGLHKN